MGGGRLIQSDRWKKSYTGSFKFIIIIYRTNVYIRNACRYNNFFVRFLKASAFPKALHVLHMACSPHFVRMTFGREKNEFIPVCNFEMAEIPKKKKKKRFFLMAVARRELANYFMFKKFFFFSPAFSNLQKSTSRKTLGGGL